MEFCNNNDLQLIVRAHECVMDGFERFAQGHLITLFSATNYCGKSFILDLVYNLKMPHFVDICWFNHPVGTANNAGAILVLGRDLVVVPKLIHPLPPALSSPETSPERHIEDTWMQVPFLLLKPLLLLLAVYESGYILITYICMSIYFCHGGRNLMQTDHQHQLGVVHKLWMIVALLHGFS